MPKMTLDRTYLHSGKHYGPGETEVPEEAAKDLQAKMDAAAKAAPPVRLDSTATGAQHPADGVKVAEGGAEQTDDSLPEDFPHRELLAKGGITTRAQLSAADDKQITDLDGIGDAKLKEIRKAGKALK